MPLYDILNEFQKGSSHMAAVVRTKGKSKNNQLSADAENSLEIKTSGDTQLTTPLLLKQDEKSDVVVEIEKALKSASSIASLQSKDMTTNCLPHSSQDIEDGEVTGIITLEDVFEELLQVHQSLYGYQ